MTNDDEADHRCTYACAGNGDFPGGHMIDDEAETLKLWEHLCPELAPTIPRCDFSFSSQLPWAGERRTKNSHAHDHECELPKGHQGRHRSDCYGVIYEH